MAMQTAFDDQQNAIARQAKSAAPSPYAPPQGVASGPSGAPAPGYAGPVVGGTGFGSYWRSSGRDTGAGAYQGLANSFNYNETGQSDLSKAGMGRAQSLIQSGDPQQLADNMYRQRENIAMRAGQASREQELADNADQYAMRGMTGSGGEAGAAAAIRAKASQARLAALDTARSEATQFGEQSAVNRLQAGMPWEQSDLGRRSQNTEWQNRAIDKRADFAAQAAAARAAGQEKVYRMGGELGDISADDLQMLLSL